MNLQEWVDHYLWQGGDMIYLIDNGSTDSPLEILQPYIDAGKLLYIYRPQKHKQLEHYSAMYRQWKIKQQVDWLIVADMDEFWFSPDTTIKDTLMGASLAPWGEGVDVIYCNWSLFGSNGHKKHPDGLRQNFTARAEHLHANCKWICRTENLLYWNIGLHTVRGFDSARTINGNSLFQLNHYIIQSEEYWRKVKLTRGDASTINNDHMRTMEYFHNVDRSMNRQDILLADRVKSRALDFQEPHQAAGSATR